MPAEVPVVLVRWEQFVLWLLDRTEKFPKRLAFTFRTRIDNLALDVYERLVEARYQRDREALLRRVNLDLEKLRLLLRLSHAQQALDHRAYEHAAEELQTVGRMIGGWRSQQRSGSE